MCTTQLHTSAVQSTYACREKLPVVADLQPRTRTGCCSSSWAPLPPSGSICLSHAMSAQHVPQTKEGGPIPQGGEMSCYDSRANAGNSENAPTFPRNFRVISDISDKCSPCGHVSEWGTPKSTGMLAHSKIFKVPKIGCENSQNQT